MFASVLLAGVVALTCDDKVPSKDDLSLVAIRMMAAIEAQDAVALDRYISKAPQLVNSFVDPSPRARPEDILTPPAAAAVTPLQVATGARSYSCMKILIQHGAHTDLRSKAERLIESQNPRALLGAIDNGDITAAEILLKSGAKLHSEGDYAPVAHVAIESPFAGTFQKKDMLLLLVRKHGADVNCKDAKGKAPLSIAAASLDEPIARVLLDLGAEADKEAIHSAVWADVGGAEREIARDRMISLLLNRGAPLDATVAVGLGNAKVVAQCLVQEPIDVERSNEIDGAPLLRLACANGHIEVVRVLIEHGLDPLARGVWFSFEGVSPLDAACIAGQLEVIHELIRLGVEVPKEEVVGGLDDQFEDVVRKKVWICSALDVYENEWLRAGAKANYRGRRGLTPLHLAAIHGNVRLVRKLIAAGAEVSARDDSGNTPLSYAIAWEHFAVQSALRGAMYPIVPEGKDDEIQRHKAGEKK